MNDRTWYLVGKMLSKEATDDELKELQEAQLSNPKLEFYIEAFLKWWPTTAGSGDEESETAFQRHLERMKDENSCLPSFLKEVLKKKNGN